MMYRRNISLFTVENDKNPFISKSSHLLCSLDLAAWTWWSICKPLSAISESKRSKKFGCAFRAWVLNIFSCLSPSSNTCRNCNQPESRVRVRFWRTSSSLSDVRPFCLGAWWLWQQLYSHRVGGCEWSREVIQNQVTPILTNECTRKCWLLLLSQHERQQNLNSNFPKLVYTYLWQVKSLSLQDCSASHHKFLLVNIFCASNEIYLFNKSSWIKSLKRWSGYTLSGLFLLMLW